MQTWGREADTDYGPRETGRYIIVAVGDELLDIGPY